MGDSEITQKWNEGGCKTVILLPKQWLHLLSQIFLHEQTNSHMGIVFNKLATFLPGIMQLPKRELI